MGKTINRLTYSFFFLLFIILTPIFLFYAGGYRYNFDTGQIEKNGAFYIKSYPRDADIYIDGEKNKNRTPNQITNIKPGRHLIEIKKEKYGSWQKELEVSSGETTFAEDIVLFYQDTDKKVLSSGSANFLLNKDQSKYALIDSENKLQITDVEQAKVFDIIDFEKEIYTFVDWSPNDQKILLKNQEGVLVIFDIGQKEFYPLELTDVDKIIWDNNNSDTLWYLQTENLFQLDIAQTFDHTIFELGLEKAIQDFDLIDNQFSILYSIDNTNYVELLDKNLTSKQVLENLNLGKLKIIISNDRQFIFTLGAHLYIQNIFQDLIDIPVTSAKMHDQRLLLSTGHEIILYNYQDDWQELIDRSSQIVSDLLWHPNGSYFLSEINEQTSITEIDGRDKRNSTPILNDPHKKLYLFNKKGNRLFILTPEENYYLPVQ